MEILKEVTIKDMVVRLNSNENDIRCRIIEDKDNELPFHY